MPALNTPSITCRAPSQITSNVTVPNSKPLNARYNSCNFCGRSPALISSTSKPPQTVAR